MRISDWSSDVCSSDLTATLPPALFLQTATPHHHLMAPAPITSKNEPRPHNPRANDHPAARRTAQRLRQGEGVDVALVDTGVDTAHPDLKGRIRGIHDMVGDSVTTMYGDRHGTAVAGNITPDE